MTTKVGSVEAYFKYGERIVKSEILRVFSKLGEECVRRVRDRSALESWQDRTGNLRSSVGYAIYEHGIAEMTSMFQSVMGGTLGADRGREMARELASQYAKTYTLVVMAAMNYASFVEAIESKDVLAGTESWAKGQIDSRLEMAKKNAIKKINSLRI